MTPLSSADVSFCAMDQVDDAGGVLAAPGQGAHPTDRGRAHERRGSAREGPVLETLALPALLDRVLGRAGGDASRRGVARIRGAAQAGPDAPASSAWEESPDLPRLARAAPRDLTRAVGLTPAQAERLAAAFELGRRVEGARGVLRPALRSAERVHRLVGPRLRGSRREVFLALLLDGKHRLERVETISVGTLTSSLVHPREVFGPALRESAAALIAVHNHPSGDPEPSPDDLEVTRRLISAGRLLGIPLLDHVIVADGGFLSLRTRLDFG